MIRLESFIGKRKAMEAGSRQIVSPGDSPEVKLQKIYARVQQIRNTSYEARKNRAGAKARQRKRARQRRGDLEKAIRQRAGTHLAFSRAGSGRRI